MAGGTRRQTAMGNGIMFEVIFNSADPQRIQPGHGVSLGYGGQVYRCNDAESVRSVHTIHTDDEDDVESNSCHQSKNRNQSPSRKPPSSSCLKKSPAWLTRSSTPSLKPSPRKRKRSRTLSPSQQSRTRSILAPFSHLSRKFVRRHSYDAGAKTNRDKSPVRQEKTKPLDQKPTAHNDPRSYVFAPPPPLPPQPQFAYQNTFPMYQYVPQPQPAFDQPQSMFGAMPMAQPFVQGASDSAPPLPPELQNLQTRINHVTAVLAANPIDLYAKHELDRLLAERNSFLDSATKRAAPPATSEPIVVPKPKTDAVRSILNKTSIDNSEDNPPRRDVVSLAASDESVADQHHICSGCGEQRSPSFHRKHPFTKPVHNVCRKCRVKKRAGDVMKRYHFCGRCGIVRSKEYHRRRGNATSVSSRLKVCRKCHASDSTRVMENVSHARRPSVEQRKVGKSADAKPVHSRRASVGSRAGPLSKQRDISDTRTGYDGASSFTSFTHSAKPHGTGSPLATDEALHAYRSPEVSDDLHQPESLESSFHSSAPSVPVVHERTEPDTILPRASTDSLDSDSGESSAPEHVSNPYYQPRNVAARLSSPFHYTETRRSPSLAAERAASSQGYSSLSDQDPTPGSLPPPLPDLPPSRYADRNQSWPGDLNLPPSPGAFFYAGRKVSASDGAQTPSPTFGSQSRAAADSGGGSEDAGERFTKGAFGRFPSSFKPSPPASPWASFSGPISNPTPEPGSKGAFYETARPPSSSSRSAASGRRWENTTESVFERYSSASRDSEPDSPTDEAGFPFRFGRRPKSFLGRAGSADFASTRGAWNINTSSTAFHRRGNEQVPEPIIEEPSSPVPNSPLATPLLLEFNLVDMSDSGVEFLTDSSSSSSASASVSGDSVAGQLGMLPLHD